MIREQLSLPLLEVSAEPQKLDQRFKEVDWVDPTRGTQYFLYCVETAALQGPKSDQSRQLPRLPGSIRAFHALTMFLCSPPCRHLHICPYWAGHGDDL